MFQSLILTIGVFGISLFSWQIGSSPILVSDIFLLGWIFVGIFLYRRIQLSLLGGLGIAFWLVAVTGIYPLNKYDPSAIFDSSSFILSATRLLMSIALLFVIAPIVRRVGLSKLGKALALTIRIHVLVIIAMGLSNIFLSTKFYRFANLGNYDPNTFLAWNRISGFFAEPSYLGWFVALCIFMIVAIMRIERRYFLLWIDYPLILSAMFLSTSLTGVLVVLIALGSAFIIGIRISKRIKWQTFLWIGMTISVIGLGGLAAFMFSQQGSYVVKRLQDIQGGGDSSFQDRIPGSLEAGWAIFLQRPYTGSGLGNLPQTVSQIMPQLRYKYYQNTDIHIAWVGVFATVGLVGGIIYLMMVFSLIKNPSSRLFGIGFFLVLFSWGGFALGVLWWFMAVALSLDKNPKYKGQIWL